MRTHSIKLKPEHIHGAFHTDLNSILNIQSGDYVILKTADVMWGIEQHGGEQEPRKRIREQSGDKDNGPALVGPVHVEGLYAGDTLAIYFRKIEPSDWGWTWNESTFYDSVHESGQGRLLRWNIEKANNCAVSEEGVKIPLCPFIGTIGMPSNEIRWQSGWKPQRTGGNMDCKWLQEGSTLFLPAETEGGLLSLGDGHAAQSNGEITGSAVECMMDCIHLQLTKREFHIEGPIVENEHALIYLGFGDTLEEAIHEVFRSIRLSEIIETDKRMKIIRHASVLLDFEITQVVNPLVGVHGIVSKESL